MNTALLRASLGLVVACSHGGGGTIGTTRLRGLTPAPGTSDVAIASSVALTLDEDLDPLTMSADAITVSDAGGAVLGTTAYDPGTRTLIWSPRYGLVLGSRHLANVSLQLRTSSGQPVTLSQPWDFHTREGLWSAPEPVTGVRGLAMDRSGNTFALLTNGVRVRRSGSWESLNLPATTRTATALMVDGSDVLTVLSAVNEQGGRCGPPLNTPCSSTSAQVYRLSDRLVWEGDEVGGLGSCGGTPTPRLTRHGAALLDTTSIICASGKSYHDALLAPPGRLGATSPWFHPEISQAREVAVDSKGRLTWIGATSLTRASGDSRGTFEFAPSAPLASKLRVAPDDRGRFVVAYEDHPGNDAYRLLARFLDDDGTFGPEMVVHESAASFQFDSFGVVLSSGDGRALVGFRAGTQPNGDSIWALRRLVRDGSMGEQFLVDGNLSLTSQDRRGTFWLVLHQRTTSATTQLVIWRERSGQPATEMRLQPANPQQGFTATALAVDESGRASCATQLGVLRLDDLP